MKRNKNLKRHEDQDDLAGEYRWGDLGQIILLLLFLAVWIADSFFLRYTTFLSTEIPNYVQIPLVIIIMFCSGYLARSGLRIVFGEVREQPVVIRKGVFGLVRHPIYLGSILFYLGLIIATLSLLSLLVGIGIIIFYHLISRYEEKLLLKKFVREYENYMQEVPMWIPGLVSRKRIP